jgi:hypothetical protein
MTVDLNFSASLIYNLMVCDLLFVNNFQCDYILGLSLPCQIHMSVFSSTKMPSDLKIIFRPFHRVKYFITVIFCVSKCFVNEFFVTLIFIIIGKLVDAVSFCYNLINANWNDVWILVFLWVVRKFRIVLMHTIFF